MPKVSECSDLSVVESDIVPRINQLCLATTNAGVRVAALSAMAALAPRLPKDHALRSLGTISKVPDNPLRDGLVRPVCPVSADLCCCPLQLLPFGSARLPGGRVGWYCEKPLAFYSTGCGQCKYSLH